MTQDELKLETLKLRKELKKINEILLGIDDNLERKDGESLTVWYLKDFLNAYIKDAEIGKLVRSRLISGNSVPVSRCYINASEINKILEEEK